MASDLEELYRHYRDRGHSEADAAALAEQKVLATPETLQRLIRVHATGYARWENRAAGGSWQAYDLALFVLGVAPVLAFAVVAVSIQAAGILTHPWLWPLLGVGVVVLGLCAFKFHQLFLDGRKSAGELRAGLFPLLFLAILSPVLGVTGFLAGAHRFATSQSMQRVSGAELQLLLEGIGRDASVLTVGLLLGMGAAVVWFIFVNRISAIEQAETAALLE
jgi:hypothetical protein